MKTKTLLALLALWGLTIIGAIVTHWKLFRYLAIVILVLTIIGLSLSIVYSLLGKPTDSKETKNTET